MTETSNKDFSIVVSNAAAKGDEGTERAPSLRSLPGSRQLGNANDMPARAASSEDN